MAFGCAPKVAKLVLFIFTFLVWCMSFVLIALSGWMMHWANEFDVLFADDLLLIVTSLIMAVGVILFVVGFSGCFGAIREGKCLLQMFFFFMIIIICLEIAAGVTSFTFIKSISESMEDGMTYAIQNTYDGPGTGDEAATIAVDAVQKEFQCCGAHDYNDYAGAKYLANDTAVPESCCVPQQNCTIGRPGYPYYPNSVWETGCVDASFDFIVKHFEILGSMCFVVLLFEGISLCLSCILIRSIKSESKGL